MNVYFLKDNKMSTLQLNWLKDDIRISVKRDGYTLLENDELFVVSDEEVRRIGIKYFGLFPDMFDKYEVIDLNFVKAVREKILGR